MRRTRLLTALAVSGAIFMTACATGPFTDQPPIPPPIVAAPTLSNYLLGDLVGGRRDRAAKVRAAGIDPLVAGGVSAYVTRLETELRRQTAGTGADVIRSGNDLVLRMPSNITFAVGSFAVQPGARSTLNEVARTLVSYKQSFVDVLGHTDASGGGAANLTLSERRAKAVADYLVSRQVARARIGSRGYGETQPIASNDNEIGRAHNRRIEIRVVPIT